MKSKKSVDQQATNFDEEYIYTLPSPRHCQLSDKTSSEIVSVFILGIISSVWIPVWPIRPIRALERSLEVSESDAILPPCRWAALG